MACERQQFQYKNLTCVSLQAAFTQNYIRFWANTVGGWLKLLLFVRWVVVIVRDQLLTASLNQKTNSTLTTETADSVKNL